MALIDLRRPREARTVFRTIVRRHPEFGDALRGLAEACLALGVKKEAVAAVRRACGPQETDADFIHGLGRLLFRHGLYQDAEACYRRGLELDGAHGQCWMGLAAGLHQRGRDEEAIRVLAEAVSDRLQGFWEAYSYLGCLLFDTGRSEAALSVLRRIPLDELRDPAAVSRLRSFLDAQAHPERVCVLEEIESRARRAMGL